MADKIDPIVDGADLRDYAPEIPLADKVRFAKQTDVFLHANAHFIREAVLRALWKTEQAEVN